MSSLGLSSLNSLNDNAKRSEPIESPREDGQQTTRSVRPRLRPIDIVIVGAIAIVGGISAAIGWEMYENSEYKSRSYVPDFRAMLVLVIAPAITFGLVTFWCTIAITRNISLSIFERIERGLLMNVFAIPAAFIVFVGTCGPTIYHTNTVGHAAYVTFAIVVAVCGLILVCFSVFQRKWLGNANIHDGRPPEK